MTSPQSIHVVGDKSADGAIFLSVMTYAQGVHYELWLLPESITEPTTWNEATDWAMRLEADLPTEEEAALIQMHGYGPSDWGDIWDDRKPSTSFVRKTKKLQARAVRRLPVQTTADDGLTLMQAMPWLLLLLSVCATLWVISTHTGAA